MESESGIQIINNSREGTPERLPSITVIIPTFNRAPFLAECLDSILAQSLPAKQIIVINDGSDDQTRDVLKPYKQVMDYTETNQVGKAGAMNRGLEIVKGEYVWIFDDDDVALPDALERFVAPLEACPQYGFSYSTCFITATRPEDNRIGDVLVESMIPEVQKQGFLIPLLEGNFLGGATLFARTACYRQVGNFNPALIRSQDYEMAIRISRQFIGARVLGGPTFHYRQHEGMRGSSKDSFKAIQRLNKWFEYDQLIFRRLYNELPLMDYLPPGSILDKHLRQAHLQRLAVMASKFLIPEVIDCLGDFARLEESSPFSQLERKILYKLITSTPYYQTGSLYNSLEVFNQIYKLSQSSPAIKRFRSETMRVILLYLARERRWRKLRPIYGAARRIKRLYV